MVQVSMVVVGAGQRGAGYARWARRHPERASVVGVAEPDAARRARFVAEHGIAAENAFCDWKELAERDRFAVAVLICTQDRMHVEPAGAFAAAATTGDRTLIKPGPRESLASHLAVLAAERSRLNGTVETIPPLT